MLCMTFYGGLRNLAREGQLERRDSTSFGPTQYRPVRPCFEALIRQVDHPISLEQILIRSAFQSLILHETPELTQLLSGGAYGIR